MNKDEIILEYLRQLEEENNVKAGNTYDKLRGNVVRANRYGNNMQTAGDFLKNNVNSEFARKMGGQMSNIGGSVANNTSALSNTLNKPVNYFKGHANGAINAAMQKLGLANTAAGAGAAGAAGTAAGTTAATTGATTAGTAAGTTAATTGATAAGTAAGTGAAAGGAAAGGATAGGAAGATGAGAAAGGSGAAAAAGPIAALAIMALMGTNRKRAKKSGQALMKHTTQMTEADNQESDARLAQSQQNTAALQEQANQALQGGFTTGQAAPVEIYDPIADYQDYLRQNGYSDDVVNGVSQGLNSGNKEIANWIDQYNAGSYGQANPIRIPQTEEEIVAARAGSFNAPIQTGGIASDDKQGILDKLVNGLTDFSKGYQENRNTAFAPENLRPDDKKGKMNKLGEAIGTISRAAQKPAMQALLAGGISTALTGDPLYGAGLAQKFGSARATTDIYKDVLAKQGIKVDPGMFGIVTHKDMDAIMTPELKKIYYQSLADYRNGKLVIDQQNADSKAIQAGAAATRADKYKGGAGGSTKVENQPHYGEALAEYVKIANSGDFDAMEFARQEFIKRYGIDPNKKVGL